MATVAWGSLNSVPGLDWPQKLKSTFKQPKGCIHARPCGLCSSPASISTWLTDLDPRTSSPTHSPGTFENETTNSDPDKILNPEVFVNAVEMQIKKTVRNALGTEAAPSRCPSDKLYVPANARSQVIQWGHSSRLSGHPGANRTTSFISTEVLVAGDEGGHSQLCVCLLGLRLG